MINHMVYAKCPECGGISGYNATQELFDGAVNRRITILTGMNCANPDCDSTATKPIVKASVKIVIKL